MRILVIGPEFLSVEKYLKKVVCVENKAILTINKKKQVQVVIDKIIDYCGDEDTYNFDVSKESPKKIVISYKQNLKAP